MRPVADLVNSPMTVLISPTHGSSPVSPTHMGATILADSSMGPVAGLANSHLGPVADLANSAVGPAADVATHRLAQPLFSANHMGPAADLADSPMGPAADLAS
ncbi:hypothetical protein BU15DRAFT_83418 [Melanogaster broomeanus]|nr:hypothetical protein BU15DRAFT_83418 [Melanogaster broomeanus]